jgi:DNA-binding GntR family transcriptional regulator
MSAKLTLTEKAYVLIEERIVTLKLKPGQIFTEKELCDELEIGRTPVREALFRLSAEKLVSTMPRKGMVVCPINISDFLLLLETRRSLDDLLVRKAAQRATSHQIKELKQIAENMAKAAEAHNVDLFMKHDREFDSLVAEASKNPFAAQYAFPLHAHCRRFWYFYNNDDELQTSSSLHLNVMKAITAKDADAAGAASDKLIQYLLNFIKTLLDS